MGVEQGEVRLERCVRKNQDGLQGVLGKTSTPELFVECIVGSWMKQGTRKGGVSDKPRKSGGGKAQGSGEGSSHVLSNWEG